MVKVSRTIYFFNAARATQAMQGFKILGLNIGGLNDQLGRHGRAVG